MRALLSCCLPSSPPGRRRRQPAGQRFVSIAFHDVVDRREELDDQCGHRTTLVQFFDWLKGTRLDGRVARRRGRCRARRATAARQGDPASPSTTAIAASTRGCSRCSRSTAIPSWQRWSEAGWRGGRTARCSTAIADVPRANFISWAEAREMQASGLVEFASHSYTLHRGVQANPQGNMIAGGHHLALRSGDTASYEDDASTAPASAPTCALAQTDRGQPRPRAAGAGVAVRPLQRTQPRSRRSSSVSLLRSRSSPSPPIPQIFSPFPAIFRRAIPPSATSRATCASSPDGRDAAHRLPHARCVGRVGAGAQDEALGRIIEDCARSAPTPW